MANDIVPPIQWVVFIILLCLGAAGGYFFFHLATNEDQEYHEKEFDIADDKDS